MVRAGHLYVAHRVTALIMAPLVLAHLALIVWAVRDGLSAEEILGRTRGSLFWAGFYGLFVVAAAVHAAIGLRSAARETLRVRGAALDMGAVVVGLFLLVFGLRAVAAVVA